MVTSRDSASWAWPLVFLGLAGVLGIQGACTGPPEVAVGAPAPAFELEDLDGRTVSSRELAGEPAVLSFWATWCQPCRKDFPVLEELMAETRVLTIALDEGGTEVVAPFARQQGLGFPILLGDQRVFERFGGFAIPYTVVLAGDGTVAGLHRGPVTLEALRRELNAL